MAKAQQVHHQDVGTLAAGMLAITSASTEKSKPHTNVALNALRLSFATCSEEEKGSTEAAIEHFESAQGLMDSSPVKELRSMVRRGKASTTVGSGGHSNGSLLSAFALDATASSSGGAPGARRAGAEGAACGVVEMGEAAALAAGGTVGTVGVPATATVQVNERHLLPTLSDLTTASTLHQHCNTVRGSGLIDGIALLENLYGKNACKVGVH